MAKEKSVAELKAELAAAQQKENKKREAEKKKYVTKRNSVVNQVAKESERLNKLLVAFKANTEKVFDEMKTLCDNYGDIRKNSQGGFTISNSDDSFRISRRLDNTPFWNELCDKGVDLIKTFLVSKLKVKDKDMFEILMTFLQKNKKGDMNYANIMHLLKHENKFTDANWIEGCRLLKENYTTNFKKYYYVFSKKNTAGEWQNISLNVASL